MKQNESPTRQTSGSDRTTNAVSVLQDFQIGNLRRLSRGRILAEFTASIGPLSVDCNVVADTEGRPSFVAPKRVKASWSQQYVSTARIERRLARELLEGVASRLNLGTQAAADAEKPGRNEWAESQEARFECAFDEFDAPGSA
jgi:hypothetical protein